jgi:hypothetical protein
MSKNWLRGQNVDEVKRIAKRFADFDAPITHGSMAGLGKQSIAAMLSDNEIIESEHSVVALRSVRNKKTSIKDFSGKICLTDRNFKYIKRIATDNVLLCAPFLKEVTNCSPTVYELWEEKPEHVSLVAALGLTYRFSKIRSSAEIIGVYTNFNPEFLANTNSVDLLTQVRMKMPTVNVKAAALEIAAVGQFTDHYSKYNKGEAWSAVALRGYGDEFFIAKPEAMSQAWKKKNEEKLAWTLHDTPLKGKLPETEKLVQMIPGVKHRVRLMRLASGGGELQRHTDQTDSEIGTQDGELMRIHIPIITNLDVVFTSWDTRGRENRISMGTGEYWYLDIRKPHRAINGGNSERIHLVMDVEACPALRTLVEG